MEILVNRLYPSPTCIIGTFAINGAAGWFSLELQWKDNQPDVSCIPAGTYDVQLLPSKRFNRIMPHLVDVPNRSEIEIHFGNYPQNTDGCILVGMTRVNEAMIGESVEAFSQIFPKLQAASDAGELISITLVDPPAFPSVDSSITAE